MTDELFPRAMSLAVHELRTPVTVAAGYLRMLLKEQAGPITDKQRKMLEEAERACGRIGALVAEMSEMGKLESRELQIARAPFDLDALVAEVASDMHEGHDRGVQLDLRGAGQPVMVTGDRARIVTAVRALTHATLRERGEPGTVVATVATATGSPAWGVFAVGDADAIDALVAGAGTATSDGFDEWRGGMGLALPVARRVVDALGGALWSAAGDRPRAGSALRLPLVNAS
ncbi:MAG: sensor histidine kinase [Vicinamibacterales bacterium]